MDKINSIAHEANVRASPQALLATLTLGLIQKHLDTDVAEKSWFSDAPALFSFSVDGLEVTLSKLGNDKVALNFSKGQRVTTAIAIIPDLIRNTNFDQWTDDYTAQFNPSIDEFIQNVNRILVAIDAPDNRTKEQIRRGNQPPTTQTQTQTQSQNQTQSRLFEGSGRPADEPQSSVSHDQAGPDRLAMPGTQNHPGPNPYNVPHGSSSGGVHPGYGPPGFEDDYEMGGSLRNPGASGPVPHLGGYGQSDLNPPGLSGDPSMRPSLGAPPGMSGGMFPSASDFGFPGADDQGPDDPLTRPPGSRYDAPGPSGSGFGQPGGGFGGFGGSGGFGGPGAFM
ncbi:hypothetical protein CJU90_2858 [Yarrowia sp. C11]|nr:hypothetical protein CKK34_4305 [Yarrowia sp. E02]KAG5369406.1 hypothetical protein CJU90_2858 [Yarrowia sp. C11]